MKLHFQEFGAGKPVILLHAFPLSSRMWSEQIVPIIDNSWRVILLDFPGFGESLIETEASGMEELAEAVADLFSVLEIEQAVIGGLSMGGYVALNFVRMFPEKVSALVLADTSAASDSEEKRASRFALVEKVRAEGSEVLVAEMLSNVISEYTKSHNPKLFTILEKEFKKATKNGVIAALLGMAKRKDQTNYLTNINHPTLLIFGEEDKITNLDAAQTLKDKIKNSTLVTIPNAGHYLNLEQKGLFNAALIDFLKKLK